MYALYLALTLFCNIEATIIAKTWISAEVDQTQLQGISARKTVTQTQSSIGCLGVDLFEDWVGAVCYPRDGLGVGWDEAALAKINGRKSGTLGQTACKIKTSYTGELVENCM